MLARTKLFCLKTIDKTIFLMKQWIDPKILGTVSATDLAEELQEASIKLCHF